MKSALELLKRVVFTERRPIVPLGGAICAMVTPFRQGVVDEEAFRRHADWLISEGIGGLVPCGTTGESPTLNEAERFRLIRACVEVTAGRVPVVAGVGSNATNATIKQVRAAQEAGADAALVVTPYYNRPSQEGLCQHYEAVVQLVDFPIILYNVPQRCGVDLETPTLIRLADRANIIGLKDATGDLSRPLNLSRSLPMDFMLLSGDDATSLDFNAAGGRGCISVVANVMPRLYAAMQYASLNGDMAKAREIRRRLGPLIAALGMETSPGPVKYALSLVRRGISPEQRLPLVPVRTETAIAIRRALDGLRRDPERHWQEPEQHGSERISVA
jgi:4-hydroxy-tetrahydrodipicolinate synthase